MADYGYLNHSTTDKRDEEAIASVFAAVGGEQVTVEQFWTPGDRHRPAFETLVEKLRPGDTLYIHSIDRLGNDTDEVVRFWRYITQRKRVAVVVLNDPALNSRENEGLTAREVRAAAQTVFDGLEKACATHSAPCVTFTLLKMGSGE